MFNQDSVEETVKHIRNLVENFRCKVCDKIDGTRMRYACGHTSCEDCAVAAVDCSLCLTPQTSFREPVIDKPLTEKVKHVVKLLNVFQDEFHIDVYKRQRLSEQLKKEKEVFPECIQAPVKYYNKRKSSINSKHNKENRLSQLPGEEIPSILNKMEQINVEQWLDKYVRKPFTDLNSNANSLRTKSKLNSYNIAIDSENIPVMRKRTHNITTAIEKQSTKPKPKKTKRPKTVQDTIPLIKKNVSILNKENDESGIGLEENEAVIVIDDSQSVTTDKDFAAFQAVIDAENLNSASVIKESIEPATPVNHQFLNKLYKVPFYLKSSLANYTESENIKEKAKENKDIFITIDNKSFTTTIQVMTNNVTKKESLKQSVEVQTEIIDENIEKVMEIALEKNNNVKNELAKKDNPNKTQNVIIEESDSDEELCASMPISVTADIHRPCEEMDSNVLAAVENIAEHTKRPRRAARGHTPASTDSSEKENFNPNRHRKTPSNKKKSTKK